MSDPNTIRILSLNGGGERGYISLVFLDRFIQQWGMTGTIAQNFDVICGTSIGGIASLAFGLGKSVSDVVPFFTEEGQWIFTIRTAGDVALGSDDASEPGNRPNTVQRIALFEANSPFYESNEVTSNYGSARLKTVISSVMGNDTLADMQTNVLITSFRTTDSTPILFSNVNLPGYVGRNELALNVGLATSAAPIYFPIVEFGGKEYIDGGVVQNNPAQVGLTLGRRLNPTKKRVCLLSLGTGQDADYYDDAGILNGLPITGGPLTLLNTLTAALNGNADTVRNDLFYRSQYTLENIFYYSFHPILDSNVQDIGLDNTDPSFLTYLEDSANDYYDNDQANITNFIGHLTA